MKNIFSTLYIFIQLACSAQAQHFSEIVPYKEFSLGNREHSSRDELIQMAQDNMGNLLLMGFVEGDSIFADVSLQKISPEGDLIWDYRIDSKTENNYDIPLKMVVDNSGNTTLIGLSNGVFSFFSPPRSSGYLCKISSDGQLLWQVNFDTLLPPHESGLYYDGFADTLGNFFVTYSRYVESGERPTYFMKFNPDGNLLQTFIRDDIVQNVGGGPAAIAQAVDSVGNFIFIHWDEENVLQKYFLRKVNPHTAVQKFTPIDSSVLSLTEKLNYGYLSWEKIWVDEYGEVYTANNLGYPLGPSLFLAKINASGTVNYILRADSTDIHFAALDIWRGYVYITGSYLPQNGSKRVAFLWKINSLGQREYERIVATSNDCVPRFLTLEQGKLFWATQDVATGLATLSSLNSGNLGVQWEYSLHNDPSYLITGSNITILPSGLLAFAATLQKEKQSGSSYLSEEEFYVETFAPLQSELYSQYEMTERGTSHVEGIVLSIDAAGNKYVKTLEIDGPEYYLIQLAPRKYYYYKFTSDWVPVWRLESKYEVFAFSPFKFDKLGNAFVVEALGQDSFMLQKISSDGIYVDEFLFVNTTIFQIFIDNNNNIHISLVSSNGLHTSMVFDNNLQPIQPLVSNLYPIVKFQLPGDEDVYYYMQDEGFNVGEADVKIVLLKNGQLLWERVFNNKNYPFNDFDLDPNTGDLLAFSAWEGSLGGFEPAIHFFSVNGTYKQAIINNGIWEGCYDVSLMPNGNAFMVYESRIDVYNSGGLLLQSIPISNTPSGGSFFNVADVFYRANHETLEGFSQEGNPLFAVSNNSFSSDPKRIFIGSDGIVTTVSTFGEAQGVGYDYGWRWLRGRIREFNLESVLSVNAPEYNVQEIDINCQPIPVNDVLQIELLNFEGKNVQILLTSLLGNVLLEKRLQATAITQLNVQQLPVGQYILTVCSDKDMVSKKVVISR